MRIRDMYPVGSKSLSFEVFPPKTEKGLEALYRTIGQLKTHRPSFISGTYGAGGSTREKTLEILDEIRRRHDVPVTAHFTCVGSTVAQIREWLDRATTFGIENIMALRGDPPQGASQFVKTPGGLSYANELVTLIKREFPHFGVGVAGYPETHREAESPEADLVNLKRKVDAGADAIFTQLFYDNQDFFRFRDQCYKMGIRVPIVPGLLPPLSLAQALKVTDLSAARLPDRLKEQLKFHENDPEAQINVGIDHTVAQCRSLLSEGVPGIHFYVLNRSDIIRRILEQLD
jgi:methylenetetrahydrofolate reductase (NADPH)